MYSLNFIALAFKKSFNSQPIIAANTLHVKEWLYLASHFIQQYLLWALQTGVAYNLEINHLQ